MSSAVKVILGVSVLAMAAGFAACDSGSSDTGGTGPIVAGSGNIAGAPPSGTAGAPVTSGGSTGTAGSGTANAGTGNLPEGVPLDPVGGWVPNTNALGIQGAMFSYADTTSIVGMTDNLMDPASTNACIKGTAAKVDKTSDKCVNMMFDAPATDCYGQYWGAAVGLNLNQTIDPATMKGATPAPYDASQLKGFAFEVEGNTVPAPGSFRFKVDNVTNEFCNVPTVKIKVGVNTVLFTDLVKECYKTPVPTEPLATTIQSGIVKISWQVVTNDKTTVPFDFCISNVRALMKDGTAIPMGGAGASGASAGASGSSAGAASTSAGAGGASAGAGGASAGTGG